MSGHPLLTTNVYIGIAVIFIAIMLYWFFYNRSVRSNRRALKRPGTCPPASRKASPAAPPNRNNPADINRKP